MDLTDQQWAIIEPLFEEKRRPDGRGRPWRDARARVLRHPGKGGHRRLTLTLTCCGTCSIRQWRLWRACCFSLSSDSKTGLIKPVVVQQCRSTETIAAAHSYLHRPLSALLHGCCTRTHQQ